MPAKIPNDPFHTFDEAWKATGYQYSADNIEKVRMGCNMAMGGRAEPSELSDYEIERAWLLRKNIHDGQLMPQLIDLVRNCIAAAREAKS